MSKIATLRIDSIKSFAMKHCLRRTRKTASADLVQMEPVTVEKHGRAVVVVMAVEEYERLRESAGDPALSVKPSAEMFRKRKGLKQA